MSKFVHNGFSTFFDGQVISEAAAVSLASLGGTSYTPQEVVENVDTLLTTNEGDTVADKKDRNAIVFTAQYLKQFPIVLQPLGTGADDWPRLFTYIALAAATGRTLILGTGQWYCLSAQDLQPALLGLPFSMYCMPGCKFYVSLTTHGPSDESGTPFYHNGGNALGATTTLNGAPTVGSNQIVVTSATNLAIGDKIAIARTAASRLQTNIITNKVGTTLTLDGPIYYPYQNLDEVRKIPETYQCRNIIIDFNGAEFTVPSADKVIEFFSAWDCYIYNIRVVDGSGVVRLGCSFDMGTVRSYFINGFFDGKGGSGAGFTIEGSRDSGILNCNAERTIYGLLVNNGYNWTVKGSARLCTYGLGVITANAADTTGSNYGYAEVNISNSVTAGVVVSDGSRGNKIKVQSTGNPLAVYLTTGPSGAPSLNNEICGSFYKDTRGIGLDGASSGFGTDLYFENLTTHYVEVTGASSFRISGGSSSDFANALIATSPAFISQDSGSFLNVSNYTINIPNPSAVTQVWAAAGANDGTIELDNVLITSPGGSNRVGLGLGNGALSGFGRLKNVRMTGGGNGLVIYDATSYCWLDDLTDFSAAATPIIGTTTSKGTVVANGAAAVAVGFPGIKSSNYVMLTRTVNGGVPGIMPYVTITAGTGFTITSVAGDTSTYAYTIV